MLTILKGLQPSEPEHPNIKGFGLGLFTASVLFVIIIICFASYFAPINRGCNLQHYFLKQKHQLTDLQIMQLVKEPSFFNLLVSRYIIGVRCRGEGVLV